MLSYLKTFNPKYVQKGTFDSPMPPTPPRAVDVSFLFCPFLQCWSPSTLVDIGGTSANSGSHLEVMPTW